MREIKFRAWDKENKEMIMPDDQSIFIGLDGVVCVNESQTFESMNGYDLILMQFTGLKDKNGKEIYEGDIVRLGNYPYINDIEEVKWQETGFNPFNEVLCGSGEEDDDIGDIQPYASFCEVIGNIYENSELLKKENK